MGKYDSIMAKELATPGVYIEEKNAFSNSIVGVPTHIPAFIGYTEKAERGKKSLLQVPTRIDSMAEFESLFGGSATTTFTIAGQPSEPSQFSIAVKHNDFSLHRQMRMFFQNGGGVCYIVSVGLYLQAETIKTEDLISGIEPLLKESEPSLLVIPEAVMPLLDRTLSLEDQVAKLYEVHRAMLKHCGQDVSNRFAILDFWMDRDQLDDSSWENHIEWGRSQIGSNHLEWGAAYFPWLHTTAVPISEVNLDQFDNPGNAQDYIPLKKEDIEDDDLVNKSSFQAQVNAIGKIDSLLALLDQSVNHDLLAGKITATRAQEIKEEVLSKLARLHTLNTTEKQKLHNYLITIFHIYKDILGRIQRHLNLLPASGAMAGIYTQVDEARGVFTSPANISVAGAIQPAISIDDGQQENLNVPLDGKAVNAIRFFPGEGLLVWGARTLDGNSQDWRYISVRRTYIFIEQSINFGLEPYTFEPNTATTWTTVKSMIENFLSNFWQQGGLAGATPEDAYQVRIGLGTTMTPVDILEGYMRVSIKLAITRPGEYIDMEVAQRMGLV